MSIKIVIPVIHTGSFIRIRLPEDIVTPEIPAYRNHALRKNVGVVFPDKPNFITDEIVFVFEAENTIKVNWAFIFCVVILVSVIDAKIKAPKRKVRCAS